MMAPEGEPAEAEPGTADNAGVTIHFEVIGSGPPLVLHHGRLGSGRFWFDAGYVEALATDRRLIVLDARGHGRSDRPRDPAAYRPEAMAGDVVAILDRLGVERADLFGYSMGGRVGFAVAAFFGSRVNTLIAGGAGPYGPARSAEAERQLARTLAGGMAAYLEEMERMLDRTIPAEDRARLLANDAEAMAALATATADWSPMTGAVAAADLPILLFGGTADPIWPLIERAAGELPRARLRAIGPFGHGEDLRRPDLVLPVVTDHLAAHGLPASASPRRGP